jgi:hypothetical protein
MPWNPWHSHGEIKITSGAGDLANAEATTNTDEAHKARLTVRL